MAQMKRSNVKDVKNAVWNHSWSDEEPRVAPTRNQMSRWERLYKGNKASPSTITRTVPPVRWHQVAQQRELAEMHRQKRQNKAQKESSKSLPASLDDQPTASLSDRLGRMLRSPPTKHKPIGRQGSTGEQRKASRIGSPSQLEGTTTIAEDIPRTKGHQIFAALALTKNQSLEQILNTPVLNPEFRTALVQAVPSSERTAIRLFDVVNALLAIGDSGSSPSQDSNLSETWNSTLNLGVDSIAFFEHLSQGSAFVDVACIIQFVTRLVAAGRSGDVEEAHAFARVLHDIAKTNTRIDFVQFVALLHTHHCNSVMLRQQFFEFWAPSGKECVVLEKVFAAFSQGKPSRVPFSALALAQVLQHDIVTALEEAAMLGAQSGEEAFVTFELFCDVCYRLRGAVLPSVQQSNDSSISDESEPHGSPSSLDSDAFAFHLINQGKDLDAFVAVLQGENQTISSSVAARYLAALNSTSTHDAGLKAHLDSMLSAGDRHLSRLDFVLICTEFPQCTFLVGSLDLEQAPISNTDEHDAEEIANLLASGNAQLSVFCPRFRQYLRDNNVPCHPLAKDALLHHARRFRAISAERTKCHNAERNTFPNCVENPTNLQFVLDVPATFVSNFGQLVSFMTNGLVSTTRLRDFLTANKITTKQTFSSDDAALLQYLEDKVKNRGDQTLSLTSLFLLVQQFPNTTLARVPSLAAMNSVPMLVVTDTDTGAVSSPKSANSARRTDWDSLDASVSALVITAASVFSALDTDKDGQLAKDQLCAILMDWTITPDLHPLDLNVLMQLIEGLEATSRTRLNPEHFQKLLSRVSGDLKFLVDLAKAWAQANPNPSPPKHGDRDGADDGAVFAKPNSNTAEAGGVQTEQPPSKPARQGSLGTLIWDDELATLLDVFSSFSPNKEGKVRRDNVSEGFMALTARFPDPSMLDSLFAATQALDSAPERMDFKTFAHILGDSELLAHMKRE